MRHCFPSLAADFAAPRLVAATGRVHSGPFLWVAPVGHVEFCHLDPDDGWLAVVSGLIYAFYFDEAKSWGFGTCYYFAFVSFSSIGFGEFT